ncbi:MAG: CDP-alcohol phosphatidyltransferase family protein [Gammaproteobacteria bacterium]|nr:CDP-alcohol phosphatidyltransferase family protein [Gammaproteobacteria bacterium]MDH5778036.1 CDP-alcohol phosphatidyltransferase family protein [Gammaproteobacteria bacterium]
MKKSDIPNLISILRILLVGPTVYLLVQEQYAVALAVFFIAGISDVADGFLARYFNWQSRLGAILDPIGDKLLMVSCFLTLGWLGQVPVLLVILVIARDLIIVIGAISYHVLIEEVSIEPVRISKLNTAMQILLVIVMIFANTQLPLSNLLQQPILDALIYIVYATTIASGIVYVWMWGQRARRTNNNRDTS